MAEQYGVSRPTLRQALNTLLLEGLLTRHPGTRVLEVTILNHDDVGFLGSRNLSEAHTLLMSKLRIAIAHVTVDKQDNLDSLRIHEEFTEQILAGRLEEARQNLTQRLNESELTVLEKIGTVPR